MLNHDFVVIVLNVEDGWRAHHVLQSDRLVLRPYANVSVTKVELLLEEVTFGLIDVSDAAELLVSTILDLHGEHFFFDAWARWIEQHTDCATFAWRHHI